MPRRLTAHLVLAAVALSLALPALSQEEEPEATPATVVEIGAATGAAKTPAVTVAPEPPADTTAPWTSKFLIPTGLLVATLVVVFTVVQYFFRVVRTRYKVVE